MSEITRVGVDLAKRQIQVHAVDALEHVVLARAMSRERFEQWLAQLPAGCIVAMEAASSAHHWARRCTALGLVPRLLAPHFVTPYRMEGKGGKNDAADAAAICEAASRPKMRFVPAKTTSQQGMLAVHRLREGYKEERTACINRIRGLLSEFGVVVAKSPRELQLALPQVLEDARIAAHARSDAQACKAMSIRGIGVTGASAMVASVGEFGQFTRAAQFAAWLGIVPRQHSSGGKSQLGRITRRGDEYLRTLLIQGARSVVANAHRHNDPVSRWIVQLLARVGWQKTLVAVANKNARILWAVLARGREFDASYVPARSLPTAA
jgi:transposase